MITGLAFVGYAVNDVARAVAFYRDVVGLRPGESFAGAAWVEFDLGATTFGVGDAGAFGFPAGTQFGAAFEVDDIEALRDRLIAQGVPVTAIRSDGHCAECFVTDPDGNRFALHQLARR